MPPASLESSFPEEWRRLSRFRVWYYIAVLSTWGFTLVCIALAVPQSLFLAGIFVAICFWSIAAIRLRDFRCPRCQERFVWGLGLISGFFQSHCAHCRLAKHAEESEENVNI